MATSNIAGSQIVVENLLQKEVIRLKDKKTVIKQAANTKYQGELRKQGDVVTVQQVPNMFGNIGGTAGDDITAQAWTIADYNLTVDQVYQDNRKIKGIEQIQSNLELRGQIANRIAFGSALNEDQFVASLTTQADSNNKLNNQSPATLSASNTYSNITSLKRVLSEQNAFESGMLFVSPAIHEKMRLENILGSSDVGLNLRLNGVVGRLDGFQVMETNNLAHVRSLTIDTIGTATDTFTVTGRTAQSTSGTGGFTNTSVVWTLVANGAASSAGEISIGTSAAETQANIVLAINGTGTPGASTYIDVSAANRTAMKNAMLKISDFSSDVATLQSAIYAPVAETFTAGTNVFGVDAELMFAVDREAINFVSQMDQFKVTDAQLGFYNSLLHEKAYGGAVLGDNAKGLATNEIVTGNA